MSLTTAAQSSSSSSAPSSRTKDDVFVEDDEETLAMLLRQGGGESRTDGDTKHSLTALTTTTTTTTNTATTAVVSKDVLKALVERFRLDHDKTEDSCSLWDTLAKRAAFPGGIHYTRTPASRTTTTTSPAADLGPDGTLHLQAVQSILGVSETVALQLTLNAILQQQQQQQKSLPNAKDGSNTSGNKGSNTTTKSNGLGTAALLHHVLRHYYRQRTARVSVICELLRTQAHDDVLDAIDNSVTMRSTAETSHASQSQLPRGLFGLLLAAAGQPDAVVRRQDFEPVWHLSAARTPTTDHPPISNNDTSVSSTTKMTDSTWKTLIRQCIERQRAFQQLERMEAMEALLVLLYHRMPVMRPDLAVLVTALPLSSAWSVPLRHMSGLVLVESMALWRIFSGSNNNDNENVPDNTTNNGTVEDWRMNHPLLQGDNHQHSGVLVDQELQAIVTLVRDATIAMEHRQSAMQLQDIDDHTAPEALALLSLGLLLHAADSNEGMELAKVANNDYDAFGYLHTVMKTMVVVVPAKDGTELGVSSLRLLPYDFRSFCPDDVEALMATAVGSDDDLVMATTSQELSASSLAYASIGRELLTASIACFQANILPTHKLPLPENVSRLANLVVVTVRNSPTLCERFWADWDVYTASTTPDEENLPMCRLLNAAHRLAVGALDARGRSTDKAVLAALAPLLQLVGSLAYTADIVHDELTAILPSGLIQCALQILQAPPPGNNSDDTTTVLFGECTEAILSSLRTLVHVGRTPGCRARLRTALDPRDANAGPGLLANIASVALSHHPSSSMGTTMTTTHVCEMLADLVEDSSCEWLWEAIRALKMLQDDEALWRSIFVQGERSVQAVTRFVDSLVCRLSELAFSGLMNDAAAHEVFGVLKTGVVASSELLPASLATPTRQQRPGQEGLSYGSAALTMDCLCHALQQLQSVANLHASHSIKAAGVAFRDCIIGALAGNYGLGQAIVHFAAAPVSLCLAATLESTLQEHYPVDSTSDRSGNETISVFSSSSESSPILTARRATRKLHETVAKIHATAITLDDAQAKGWLDAETTEAPFTAALSALRLLNWWAKSVGKLTTEGEIDNEEEVMGLSPWHLLEMPTALPLAAQKERDIVCTAWMGARVPVFSVLLGYVPQIGTSSIVKCALATEALDFVSISLFHGKLAPTALANQVCQSSALRGIVRAGLDDVTSLTSQASLSRQDRMKASAHIRFLRMLEAFLDASPYAASNILELDGKNSPSVFQSLIDGATNGINLFRSTNVDSLLKDTSNCTKLRVAIGCLGCLRAVWRMVRLSSSEATLQSLLRTAEGENSFLGSLCSFVFRNVNEIKSSRVEKQILVREQGLLVTMAHLSLDILATELFWAHESENFSPDLAIVRSIAEITDGDLSRITRASALLLDTANFERVETTSKALYAPGNTDVLSFSSTTLLQFLSGPSSHSNCGSFMLGNGYNIDVGSLWFIAVAARSAETSDVEDLIPRLAIDFCSLHSELCCLQSWKHFSQILHRILVPWRNQVPQAPLFSTAPSIFKLSFSVQGLRSMQKNLKTTTTISQASTRACLTMANHCSGLALLFLDGSDLNSFSNMENWIEMINLVSDCAGKVSRLTNAAMTHDFKSTMTNLFATAVLLFSSSQSRDFSDSADYGVTNQSENICVELAETTCTAISTIKEDQLDYKYICSCVAVLDCIVEKTCSAERHTMINRICQMFKKYNVIRSLVFISTAQLIPRNAFDADSSLLSVLGLFTKMGATGDKEMMSLLVSNEAMSILSSCCNFPSDSASSPSRGYSNGSNCSEAATASMYHSDPKHVIWMAGLQLMTALLRSSDRISRSDDGISKHFSNLAIGFVNENKEIMLSCIRQCCLVEFGKVVSEKHSFTLNVLREAGLIFAIIAELCNQKTSSEKFRLRSPDLFSAFRGQAATLSRKLSLLLGAAGTSREIFRALNEIEKSDAMTIDHSPQLIALNPLYRLIAGGLQYTKHEGIRYSSQCMNAMKPVTSDDFNAKKAFTGWWNQSERQTGNEDPSMTSLEQKCCRGVSNHFSFQIEFEAANCLLSAISILWRTHPASSSFVMYTEEEASRLDGMRFVKPGMAIAFRQKGNLTTESLFLRDDSGKRLPSHDQSNLSFARIVACDTVKRLWRATLLNRGTFVEECTINEAQLAGIEDKAKRTMLLDYAEAPDSSSTLEAISGSLSTGHLILVLRWCCQFHSEDLTEAIECDGHPSIVRLAELTSAFLGLELALRAENSPHRARNDDMKSISFQLLDLFGSASEFGNVADCTPGVSILRDDGRLHSILSINLWHDARVRLKPYLDVARDEIASSSRLSQAPAIPAGSLFLRRTSSISIGSPNYRNNGN